MRPLCKKHAMDDKKSCETQTHLLVLAFCFNRYLLSYTKQYGIRSANND